MSGASSDSPVSGLRYEGMPARADTLPELRHAVARWVDRVGLSFERVAEVELAVYEALANVVEHAYREGGTFDLRSDYHADTGVVEIVVADRGTWRPPAHAQDANGGRGLVLMRKLADSVDVDVDSTGTTVRFRWRTSGEPNLGTESSMSGSLSSP